jgi:hypothetical protein
MSFVALMLCTCRRWDRVTSRLIAAVENSGLLDDAELDELADSCLSHEHVISYPLAWASPRWLGVQLDGGNGRTYTVNEDTLGEHRPSLEPPLRRWAAQRALRSDPVRLEDLLRAAELFELRHHGALIHGLLDAADFLDEPHRRDLIRCGLNATRGSVRRTALDRLCELDGPGMPQSKRRPERCGAEVATTRTRQPADSARSVTTSRRPTISGARLDALIEEATVDRYNEDEQVTGLFTMLEDNLTVPFQTSVLGISVTVTSVELTDNDQIVAICHRDGLRQAIPILDLPLPAPAPEGAEWIEAHRRWLR